MNTSAKRAVAACALLAGTALSTPTLAQQSIDPPTERTLTPMGVDLKRGAFVWSREDISIGGGDASSGLSLVRTYDSKFRDKVLPFGRGTTHNYDISLILASGTGTVNFGLTSLKYTFQSGYWGSRAADGSTLQPTDCGTVNGQTACTGFLMTLRDGSYLHFTASRAACTNSSTVCMIVTDWVAANGHRLNFTYDRNSAGWPSARLKAVKSSTSRTVYFDYDDSDVSSTAGKARSYLVRKVTVVNDAEQFCGAGNACMADWPSVSYAYADAGTSAARLTSVTDRQGKAYRYGYDAATALMTSVGMPSQPTTDFITTQYDGSGNVQSQTDAAGKTWGYAITGAQSTITDPTQGVTRLEFGTAATPRNKPTKIAVKLTATTERTTDLEYDQYDRLTKRTSQSGAYLGYVYDDRGNVTEARGHPSDGSADRVVTAGYDACSETNKRTCNEPRWTKDAKGQASGQQTDYEYDTQHGGVTSITYPADANGARPRATMTYAQRQARAKGSTGQPTVYSYMAPLWVRTGMSQCIIAACTGAGELKQSFVYDGDNSVTNNANPRSSTVEDVSGTILVTTYGFDRIGNLTSVDGPRPGADDTSSTEYDAERRPVKITDTDPDGTGPLAALVTVVGYDDDGHVTRTAQQKGTAWLLSCARYAATGRVERQWGAAETGASDTCPSEVDPVPVVDYAYDDAGRPTGATQRLAAGQGGDRVSAVEYNLDGTVRKERFGLGSTDEQDYRTYTYTADGNPETVKDARGNLTTYGYTGFDELKKLRYPDAANGAASSTTDVESYHYDANGNLDTLTQRDGSIIGFGYDALDRLVSKDVPETDRDVTYTYDLLGRMTGANLPGANASMSVTWGYDKLGRVLTTTSMGRTVGYSYASDLGSATMTYPDGKTVIGNVDALGRTTEIFGIEEPYGGGYRQQQLVGYTYDQLSRRTAVVNGNLTSTAYGYDTLGRLQTLGHDLAGTAQDVTFTLGYNRAEQITSRGFADGYAWDNALNQDRGYQANGLDQYTQTGIGSLSYDGRGNLARDMRFGYVHDSESRLTGVSGSVNMQLAYDAIGRLARITSTGAATDLLYDGDALVGEYDAGSGALLRRYVHGPGVDEPIVWYEGAGIGDKRWLHADERGSIVAGTNASGALIFTNSYGPFGEPGKVMTGRFGYTGQMHLPEIGLYYYKSRFYSPQLGRFIETDPIGTADDQNLYGYVGNDPVNLVDPMGLQAVPAQILNEPFSVQVGRYSGFFPGVGRLDSLPWWSDVVGTSALNFTAGFTGTLTFGLSDYAFQYAGVKIDSNSTAYKVGEVTGIVATTATGFGAGLEIGGAGLRVGLSAARRGLAREGLEYSHFIPRRFLPEGLRDSRSLLNGNVVTTKVHALSDPYRFQFMSARFKLENRLYSGAYKAWVRTPRTLIGSAAGTGYGTVSAERNQ